MSTNERPLGRPIDPSHVPLVMAGLHQVLPGWLDPSTTGGHSATYELRLRGYERHVYQFTDGNLAVNPPNIAKSDVHISIDPTTRLLLNYGRIKPGKAALTGKVLAWGRLWAVHGPFDIGKRHKTTLTNGSDFRWSASFIGRCSQPFLVSQKILSISAM